MNNTTTNNSILSITDWKVSGIKQQQKQQHHHHNQQQQNKDNNNNRNISAISDPILTKL